MIFPEPVINDPDFYDEAIQKQCQFSLDPYALPETIQTSPQQYTLNIQHYFSNQSAFQQLLVHIHNQLQIDNPLVQTIREYLNKKQNQLLTNKQTAINELDNQLFKKQTERIILEGNLLGTTSFLESFKKIMEKRESELVERFEKLKGENVQIRSRVKQRRELIQKLEEEIQDGLKRDKPEQVKAKHLEILKKQTEKQQEASNYLESKKSQLRSLQYEILHRQNMGVVSTDHEYNRQFAYKRDKIVNECVLTLRTKIIEEKEGQLLGGRKEERKVVTKYGVKDNVLPMNRIIGVIVGIFVAIHVIWRMIR